VRIYISIYRGEPARSYHGTGQIQRGRGHREALPLPQTRSKYMGNIAIHQKKKALWV
jgi:hypothetical protein